MKRIRQINNLTIRYSDVYRYSVWTPDKRCLEDRLTLEQAEEYCTDTKDFLRKKKIVDHSKKRWLYAVSFSQSKPFSCSIFPMKS